MDDVNKLDDLILTLTIRGIREDKLKRVLKFRYNDIVASIKLLNE